MGVNGTGAAASKVSVNPFPWGAACLCCPFAPMGQLRGRQRGPSRGDASPHFPGDAAGEKTLSWCAFLGFWSYGLEEGAFSVRCRPGCGLSPYGRVRALPWFSFGLTPSKGKVAVFLKESRLKNFYARCARRPVSLLYDLFRLMAPLEQRLPQGASRRLAMADGQGQGVGGIVGLGDFLQSQ